MGLFLQHFKSTQTMFLSNQEKSPGCLCVFSALPFTDSDTNELLQKGAQGRSHVAVGEGLVPFIGLLAGESRPVCC